MTPTLAWKLLLWTVTWLKKTSTAHICNSFLRKCVQKPDIFRLKAVSFLGKEKAAILSWLSLWQVMECWKGHLAASGLSDSLCNSQVDNIYWVATRCKTPSEALKAMEAASTAVLLANSGSGCAEQTDPWKTKPARAREQNHQFCLGKQSLLKCEKEIDRCVTE